MSLKKYMRGFLLAVAVITAIFSPGCESVETDLTYKIVPYLDLPDVDTLIPYSPWTKIYVHFADTSEWQVDSWKDAEEGYITAKDRSGERLKAQIEGVRDGDFIYVGPFTEGPIMLVAYDGQPHGFYDSKMYGWRQVDIQPGIAELRIPVIFTPEKRGDRTDRINQSSPADTLREVHVNSKWFIANDNPYIKDIAGGDDEDDDDDDDDDTGRRR